MPVRAVLGDESELAAGPDRQAREIRHAGLQFTVVSSQPDDHYFASLDPASLPPVVHVALSHCAPDAVVVDVGANIGVTAFGFALVAPEGCIVAVEPGARAFADLRAGVDVNRLRNIQAVHTALGRSAGTAELMEASWNTAGAFLGGTESAVAALHADDQRVVTSSVPVRTLDELVTTLGLECVDLVKIDVEGSEADVLAGGSAVLDRFQPMVLLEFNVFTQSVMAGVNPLDFLLELCRAFPHLHAVDGALELQRITSPSAAYALVHRCFSPGEVVDLIGTFAPLPLRPLSLVSLAAEVAALRERLAEVVGDQAELEAAAALTEERRAHIEALDHEVAVLREHYEAAIRHAEAVTTRLEAVEGSTSWRVTAPIRRLGSRH